MRKVALILIAGCILFCAGCKNESYDEGVAFADEVYGKMDFAANGMDMTPVLKKLEKAVSEADSPQAFWDGFCDRGEEILTDRISEINDALGSNVLDESQISAMFDQMRAGFQE